MTVTALRVILLPLHLDRRFVRTVAVVSALLDRTDLLNRPFRLIPELILRIDQQRLDTGNSGGLASAGLLGSPCSHRI